MAEARPPERTPFFEFQARNRRATWRLTLAYALVVGGCGFVSAVGFVANVFLVLFALVFLPAVLCLGIGALALLSPATAGLTHPIWDVGLAPLGIVGRLPSLLPGDGETIWVIGLLLPLVCWLTVRSVWRAAGVGHTLLAIGARPPRPGTWRSVSWSTWSRRWQSPPGSRRPRCVSSTPRWRTRRPSGRT